MIEKLINLYKRRKRIFNPIITLGYSFAILKSWLSYPLLGWVIFYIPTVIFIYFNYKKLINLGGQWIKILLGFSGLFFVSKIYAEKILNYQFDIEVQYLNYSATIYAAILTVVFGACIIFLRYLTPYLLKSMWYGIANYFSAKYRERTQSLTFFFEPLILLGLFLPVIFISSIAEELTPYYLLADAYATSDCGKKLENTFYIRKNVNQCYAIQLGTPPIYGLINKIKEP